MNNTLNEATKLIHEQIDATLVSFPMWMRFNYLCNTINNVLQQGNSEDNINWDKVNEILTNNRSEYDFNHFKRIETVEQLVWVRGECLAASMDMECGIWQSHMCKDCGNPFMMNYREVKFYEEHQLHIPKRCKSCRAKRKAGK
jgi:hypothetical protein